jgi:hypothetical protein
MGFERSRDCRTGSSGATGSRYEELGPPGLADCRLRVMATRRVPVDKVACMLNEYRTYHGGWDVRAPSGAQWVPWGYTGRRPSCTPRIWCSASRCAAAQNGRVSRRHNAASGRQPVCMVRGTSLARRIVLQYLLQRRSPAAKFDNVVFGRP